MKEITGDIWQLVQTDGYTGLCIPTNGNTNRFNRAVMGRGVAYQATQHIPGVDLLLAMRLQAEGNHVFRLHTSLKYRQIFSFPVKHLWRDSADPELIKRSAGELMALLEDGEKVLLPWPGCGNGGLTKDIVRPVLEPILSDRVVLVDWA